MSINIRRADRGDLNTIVRIDRLSFPSGDPDAHRAQRSELSSSVDSGQVLIAEVDGPTGIQHVAGFLEYVSLVSQGMGDQGHHSWFVSRLAVFKKYRRRGIARRLMSALLEEVESRRGNAPMISGTTSVSNLAALRLFLREGFVVSRVIPGFFGMGRDRLFLEWRLNQVFRPTGHRFLVPVESSSELQQLLNREEYLATGLVKIPHGGTFFQVDHVVRSNADELASWESSVSVSLMGVLLAAATFLIGSLVISSRAPVDILLYLVASFVFLTISLLAYANASGEVGRLKTGRFLRHMMFGNIASEFGGVYPLLHVLPVLVATRFDDWVLGLAAAGLSTVALWSYHLFGLSMVARYLPREVARGRLRQASSLQVRAIMIYLTASPVVGAGLFAAAHTTLPWSTLNAAALTILAGYAASRSSEQL